MILTRDDTFRVVFNLRTPVNATQFKVGTGVFVARYSNEPFLVTATHVARTCTNATQLVLSDQAGNATELQLADFNGELAWQHHPVADISVLRVIPNTTLEHHLEGRFLDYDHFHLDRTPVSRDFELTSVGFPNGFGTVLTQTPRVISSCWRIRALAGTAVAPSLTWDTWSWEL